MKNDEFYKEYITYLEWRFNKNQINKGKLSLLKMSKQSFDDFKSKLERDGVFNEKIIEIMKSEIRDKKIDDIFDDFD
jgi:hypothetical protein